MRNLIIIGAGGNGRVVADIARKMEVWDNIAFLDDNSDKKRIAGLEVLGNIKKATELVDDHEIFVAIGDNNKRNHLHQYLREINAKVPNLIHPNAVIGNNVVIKQGTAVMAGAIINCDCIIDEGCIINTGATVDHDNNIGSFVHVSPGVHLAGAVTIGKNTWIGIGAIVSNNIKITSDCIIGAGTVIIRDIEQPGTYVGVPSRKI